MNHGIVSILKTHRPPQGLGQSRCLSSGDRHYHHKRHKRHTDKIFTVSKKIRYPPLFLFLVFIHDAVAVRNFSPPRSGHENRRWPPFQLSGSRGSPRLLKKRKALVTALGFSPACHKMSPDTKPSHSYQRTPTALPTNVTSFFPPTAKRKKRKKLNSPLPCQLK